MAPKSEAAPVGAKDEPTEPDSEEPAGPEEQEELRRLTDAFPPSSESTPRQPEEHRGPTVYYAGQSRDTKDPYWSSW